VLLVAEAWDAAPGGYQVGTWPGNEHWAVWNDRFRDDVRRAWLQDPHLGGVLATRLTGSSDLFYRHGPLRGVNLVTSHDGFTLRDLVSYDRKHNEANGEQGRDGHGGEPSANHGVEGDTKDRAVLADREKSRRNLAASLLLAHGVPMFLAGDELGRTQRGNNNAYCHDSELTWVDWRGAKRDAAFLRFVRGLIALRRSHEALRRDRFLAGNGDVTWFGPEGQPVDWEEPGAFGYVLQDGSALCVVVNLYEEHRTFTLPPSPRDAAWRLVVDTAADPPHDLYDPPAPPHAPAAPALVTGRSLHVYVG
jgi:isoamylase